jgi:PhoH-like ATPase
MKFDNVYVLDTNIILNDANDIFTISQEGNNLIVLPETVIDELDTKKTGFER